MVPRQQALQASKRENECVEVVMRHVAEVSHLAAGGAVNGGLWVWFAHQYSMETEVPGVSELSAGERARGTGRGRGEGTKYLRYIELDILF